MHHHTVRVVLHMNLDRVTRLDADERSGNLLVEGPVGISRSVVQLAFHLDGLKINTHHLWRSCSYWSGKIRRITDDVGRVGVHGRARSGHNLDQTFHARLAVTWDRAEIGEFTCLRHGKGITAGAACRPGCTIMVVLIMKAGQRRFIGPVVEVWSVGYFALATILSSRVCTGFGFFAETILSRLAGLSPTEINAIMPIEKCGVHLTR